MVKKEEEDNSDENRQYPFVFYNCAVLSHKTTKLLIFVFSFDLNNKLNDLIIGSLVRSRFLKMAFIIRVKSYMEVSSETSDIEVGTTPA